MTPLLATTIPARHGFFTRAGGVSTGPYASLNGSTAGADDPAHVMENRARIARHLGATTLLGLSQVHGAGIVTVLEPWTPGMGAKADGMVTNRLGLALGIVTADCAPVLLHDAAAGVIGAVHAGWRSAVLGVLEAAIHAMAALGAKPDRIVAAIGPCIRAESYEVGDDLRDQVLASGIPGTFFRPGRPGHWQFDLPAYCAARLPGAVEIIGADTLPDPDRFWSHRRRTLGGGGPIGHQVSAIVL